MYYYDVFCYKISENIVDYSLKDNRAISHIKEYYQRFKKSTLHTEDYLSLVVRLNIDIIEFLAYIHLSEVIGSLEFGNQFKNQRE